MKAAVSGHPFVSAPAILDEPGDSMNSSDYVTHLKLLRAGNEGMAICRDKS